MIDLYQIHCWDSSAPLDETLATLHDMVRAGKVRYIGVSNVTGWQLQRYLLTARHMGAPPIVSYQAQYNLLDRHIEWELLPQCVEEGIGLLPWSPLGGGWLAGKYRPDQPPTGPTRLGDNPARGVEAYAIRNTERTWRILDEVGAIASARGVAHAQVALNWLRRRPSVSSVILGARTVAQLDENLGALEWSLTVEEAQRLDMVAAPGLPDYPYGFIEDARLPTGCGRNSAPAVGPPHSSSDRQPRVGEYPGGSCQPRVGEYPHSLPRLLAGDDDTFGDGRGD